MDDWVQTLSTPALLSIALVAIAVLLVMIIKFKVHPLLALVIVSIATAFATRIPISEIQDVLIDGFGATLGEVALLVGLGAMFGRLAEISGGAQALSDALIRRFGDKRAPFALGVASLLFGFPIFFDAAFMVMLPIIFSVARRLGGSVLLYVLPAAAALSTMHVFLPPHPGAVASTVLLGGDVGLTILIGIVVAVPTWYIAGYLYGTFIGRRIDLPVPDLLSGGPRVETVEDPPKPSTIIALLMLPLVLIFANTAVTTAARTGTLDAESPWVTVPQVIGSTPVALLITVLVSTYVLALRRGRTADYVEDLLDNALKPIAPVVLITGAGGMFGAVLLASGIGDALAETLRDLGLPLIVSTFIIAAILRIALGTATVAITTSAGLLGASIMAAGLNPVQTVAMILTLAAGSSIFPHVNDASFWLIGKLLGMDVPTTFKTWSVIKTLISIVGFALSGVVYVIASV
ncbi:GntP family permease [Rhodococcus sp. BP-252]|uniref:GntP family permease n=1 Tax=unclassified Rhodococcus (in: high G+C Gram-positive bacteria) TaxID=192944 RepID=UPI001C9A4EF0|nr:MULTISPECIES: gluconate:H+ symporter [unclassified Rhodococcus (in: high G+C Gram-positive bacteria)]MBY6413000.1 GntP family permease [Rhodococcus sp. BP-320]MBY6418561.1 GntP family permease [Rhodococcus sp. BP-321]MBY6422737.1 GntP family permease [Rhodococcus sp. BP-324]MBY6428473.1 GntP family permease [Rhodococcus sp. BP-323]MBY6432922.1 GntP family permease [Rhodococcus sp. BP-322]